MPSNVVCLTALKAVSLLFFCFTNLHSQVLGDTLTGYKIQVNIPKMTFEEFKADDYEEVDRAQIIKKLQISPVDFQHRCNSSAINSKIESLFQRFGKAKLLVAQRLLKCFQGNLFNFVSKYYEDKNEYHSLYSVVPAFEGLNDHIIRACYKPDLEIFIDSFELDPRDRYRAKIIVVNREEKETIRIPQVGSGIYALVNLLEETSWSIASQVSRKHPVTHSQNEVARRQYELLSKNKEKLFNATLPTKLKQEIQQHYSLDDDYQIVSAYVDPDGQLFKGFLVKNFRDKDTNVFELARKSKSESEEFLIQESPIEFFAMKFENNWHLEFHHYGKIRLTKQDASQKEKEYYGRHERRYYKLFNGEDTLFNYDFLKEQYLFQLDKNKVPPIVKRYTDYKFKLRAKAEGLKFKDELFAEYVNPLKAKAVAWSHVDSLEILYSDTRKEKEIIYLSPDLKFAIYPMQIFQEGKKLTKIFFFDLSSSETLELIHSNLKSTKELNTFADKNTLPAGLRLWPLQFLNRDDIFNKVVRKKDKYGDYVFLFELEE